MSDGEITVGDLLDAVAERGRRFDETMAAFAAIQDAHRRGDQRAFTVLRMAYDAAAAQWRIASARTEELCVAMEKMT